MGPRGVDVGVGIVGASGFLGTLLLDRLVANGTRVVAISRRGVAAHELVDDVRLDIAEASPDELRRHLDGCAAVYYLVHSLGETDFPTVDRRAARHLVTALEGRDVRVAYVGSLGRGGLSTHVASRQEVGRILGDGTEAVELRASLVIGKGSVGFEMLRSVVSWGLLSSFTTTHLCQPIAVCDAVRCLEAARSVPAGTYDLAGPEVLTYREVAELLADVMNRRLRVLPLPPVVMRLSAWQLARAVGISRAAAAALLQSLETDTVATGRSITELIGLEAVRPEVAFRDGIRHIAVPDGRGFPS